MSLCTLMKIMNEMVPASNGEMTQLDTMGNTPAHFTESTPTPTAAKPITAPMMECVVETGQPLMEATSNQVPAASSAASMPNTICSGVIIVESTMPLRIVWVTEPPAR